MKLSDLPPVAPIPDGNPYIMQIPVVSTCHVSESDMDELQGGDVTLVAQDEDNQCVIIGIGRWDDPVFSHPSLTTEANLLFRALASMGYRWVRLDAECGDRFTDLTTFDW